MATLFQLPREAPLFAGASLPGALAYFFEPGTTTPITTYTTPALSTGHVHPVVADADGVFPAIYVNEAVNSTYRLQLKTSAGVLKYDEDNLPTKIRPADVGQWAGTAGGSANALTLTPSPAISAYATGQCFRFLSASANTSAVTVAVSGLATKGITKNGSTALVAGDIPSGAVVTITYDGTQFQMVDVITTDFGTYTGTFTGCTTAQTVTISYAVVGNVVTLQIPVQLATSNATTFTITGAPAALRPTGSAAAGYAPVYSFTDAGTLEYGTVGVAMTNTGILSFVRSGSSTGFTNSGNKGPSEFVFAYIRNAG